MLKRFAAYYKPHMKIFIADMTAAMLVALIGIVYPIVTRKMLNELIPDRMYREIIICGSLLLILYVAKMLLNYFIQYYGHMMGVHMQAEMRRDMFAHLQKLPFSYYDNHETGKIMSRMTNDLFDISELAHHGPENLLISTASIILSFVYLTRISLPLTLITFACVPFLLLIAMTLRQKMRVAFKEMRVSMAEINGAIESSVSGIKVTKAFTNSAKEEEKFDKCNESFIKARVKSYKAMGQFMSGNTFVTDVFNVVVLIAGGLFLYSGEIGFGDYSAFIVSVNMFISPLMTLINFMEMYQNGVSGFERFCEIIDAEPEKEKEGVGDIDNVQGNIEIKNLSYAYTVLDDKSAEKSVTDNKDKKKKADSQADNVPLAEEKPVLHDISLKIDKGMTFALVGPSGGGKTTLCHLIPHFYDYAQGQIFIDGRELHDISLQSLRKNIGIVQQDIYLFNASIKENILYGRLDATDEEIVEAAKRANIHDWIMSLEKGYATEIGERGVRLSGGQKQRLSIARVFLKNPPILILDEATSALDNTTEILIQQSLDELCRGRTTIVVAHRLSTIRNADKIAVISDGAVAETGTHDQLIAKGGIYADLYRLQFRANTGLDEMA